MTENTNKALWDRVKVTDPKAVKPITGKQYQGNSPKPYWIVERLTEEFGPCGIGWGFSIINERMERLAEDEVLHVAVVQFWYLFDGKRGELEQIGQTRAVYPKKSGGLMVDEDAPKKSVTDALVKCASYIGFAGDIFSGRWDDSKYVAWAREQYEEPAKAETPVPRISATQGELEALEPEQREYILDLAMEVIGAFKDPDVSQRAAMVRRVERDGLDDTQKMALWSRLDSKTRTAFKQVAKELTQPKEPA